MREGERLSKDVSQEVQLRLVSFIDVRIDE